MTCRSQVQCLLSHLNVCRYCEGNGEPEWQRPDEPAGGAIAFAETCQAPATHLPITGRVPHIGEILAGTPFGWLSEAVA